MNFRTEITPDSAQFKLNPSDKITLLGSCFADNMGGLFKQHRLSTMANPYGVLYNPFSVADAIESIIERRQYHEDDLFFDGELWHSPWHHGQFSHPNKKEMLLRINLANNEAHAFLASTNILFITLGTSWVYKHKQLGMVVANCHKQPADHFVRYRLSIDEITERYTVLLAKIKSFAPQTTVVFTVSPVRHWKDTAHGNQLSKAILLLSIEQLVQKTPFATYFPAYELVMDDLRDYRFYDRDMLHPSEEAVSYIWAKLKTYCFTSDALAYISQTQQISKAIQHRPLHANAPSYAKFLLSTLDKINQIEASFPQTDLSLDKALISKLLDHTETHQTQKKSI